VTSVSKGGVLSTTGGPYKSDLCVGADGIHSIARTFTGNVEQAKFTGQVAWRGVITAKDVAPHAQIWMAPGRHVVIYPLQGDVVNVVAVQEREAWAEEGWHHADDPANLQAAFADCAPELRKVLSHVTKPLLWGLFRHPVAEHWYNGQVAILGDAAHPTLPFLAQGANMAIEDAWVLAAQCDRSDLEQGLAQYQALRKPRVTRAIAAASSNARNYHFDGVQRRVAHLGLKTLGKVAPNAFLKRLSWLYDFDVTQG
jgi:salicylate hydroxylase